MDGALRGFADALLRAAKVECTAPGRGSGTRCGDPICRVAALHDALARSAWDDVAAQLTPDVEVEYFGVHLPGFARVARGSDAAVELLRANAAAMRWSAVELEAATSLGDTLILFHRERGDWSPGRVGHAAVVVTHFLTRDGRLARIRARSFPLESAAPSP